MHGIFACFMIVLFSVAPVAAQEKINVRSGVHDTYTRLVFDWAQVPPYNVSRNGTDLKIDFQRSASIDIGSIQRANLPNVTSISLTSQQAGQSGVVLKIPTESRYRHFSTGGRVVIDIYNPDNRKQVAAPEKKERPQTQEKKAEPEETAEVTKVEDDAPGTEDPIQQDPLAARENLEEQADKKDEETTPEIPVIERALLEAQSNLQPHKIELTSTQTFGVSAFVRAGFLWFVVDDPALAVPPVIKGPQQDQFPPFEKISVQGGIAYRMPVPQGFSFYGEGGGLRWGMVMTPNARNVDAIEPVRGQLSADPVYGGLLKWPMEHARRVIEIEDPLVGDVITTVTVDQSDNFAGPPRRYVDLDTLSSSIGLAFVSKVDDLAVTVSEGDVSVTSLQGLSISSARDTRGRELRDGTNAEPEENGEGPRIFNFSRWEMGGLRALEENRRVLMLGLSSKKTPEKIQDLLTLAKLHLANGRSYEALGYLRVSETLFPDIKNSPEYSGLVGAANVLSSQYDKAIVALSRSALQNYPEINHWRSVALAGLEDWQQAASVLPNNFDVVAEYSRPVRVPLGLMLAEVALRNAELNKAEGLLAMINADEESLNLSEQSALAYLRGELLRQRGDLEETQKTWSDLSEGKDDLYRAKAALALTRLELENDKIEPEKAIDRLEGLRYAWRGDELETLINYRLGKTYLDTKDYLKGLSVLRNTVTLSSGTKLGREVTDFMTNSFRELFMNKEKLQSVSPLEAISIYDEFRELTPTGEEGDKLVQQLSERLVEVDLLERAGKLLEHQLLHRLDGVEAVRVGIRLAAIRLLDNKPDGAMRALDVAEETLNNLQGENVEPVRSKFKREIDLLRARALFQSKETTQALALLETMKLDEDVNKLRADISWQGGRWDDAAAALQDLIFAENISLTRPLTNRQAELILSRAVALNLSQNRVALANLRERYSDAMLQTDNAKAFDLVTRPRTTGLVSSRDAIASMISEVDLFKDFLDDYSGVGQSAESN